jgi:hypothetical protein
MKEIQKEYLSDTQLIMLALAEIIEWQVPDSEKEKMSWTYQELYKRAYALRANMALKDHLEVTK